MDVDSDQLELKKILVDLEDERKHLEVSIGHLEHEISKREVEVQRLLAESELDSVTLENQTIPRRLPRYNSGDQDYPDSGSNAEFIEQVDQLLKNIATTSEELISLIKL